ncbi:MAG: alanine--tRNA ligase [Desulfobacteraceae bacterium]|nr:alanine--tRNA ligase [Desulfobacteraceae bacterium]
MTGNEARKIFIEYFKKYNHHVVRSASLVPDNDPTLLFTNAGMVQFKRIFTGDEKRDYSMAVTSQKCVRAGGKHNDLENVGYTARHHTFFEMLGNFSFGEYFKEKAIEFGWDLLINGYGLDASKLWVSVFLDDDEAYDLWRDKIGVPEDRIVRLGEEENFWAMGDTGPCGPCSEIHIDRGEEFGCDRKDCAVGCDCDRYLELWNLVFMQYEKDETGEMKPLPKPSIDTGLGLERIVSVLQDTKTNYETDLFVPIMERVEELCGKKTYESRQTEVAMKVIADHSRATAFLITDGILPSNEGRGYVLRRIIRRAIRYGRNLGLKKPFLHHTIDTVFDIMGDAYPELRKSSSFIFNVVKNEENQFLETLDIGIKLLDDSIKKLTNEKTNTIPGDLIFKLYDTFGFPVDIIQDVVKDTDLKLDLDGFNKSMNEQKLRSKGKVKFEGVSDAYKSLTKKGVKTKFTGYNLYEDKSDILIIVKDDKNIDLAKPGDAIEIVTINTPFYAESGGQAGDSGIFYNDKCKIRIDATFSDPSGLSIHKGEIEQGELSVKDKLKLKVDIDKRKNTENNHTSTHILHYALKQVLGDHVKQSGSLVSPDRLRFDFTHFSKLTDDELNEIVKIVNMRIRENYPVKTEEMSMDDASKTGATALFEEKYGDKVRVVSLGDFSKELCGGTHTERSGNIGVLKILSEEGIASGIRRIEAVTGAQAIDEINNDNLLLKVSSSYLKGSKIDIPDKINSLLKEKKQLQKEIDSLKTKIASKFTDHIDDDLKDINGIKVLSKKVEIENPSQLRDLADKFKGKIKSGVILLGAESNGKALLISIVTDDLTKKYKAGDIVKKAASLVGGGGGGRPDMAQAGGSNPDNLDKALNSVYDLI